MRKSVGKYFEELSNRLEILAVHRKAKSTRLGRSQRLEVLSQQVWTSNLVTTMVVKKPSGVVRRVTSVSTVVRVLGATSRVLQHIEVRTKSSTDGSGATVGTVQ